MLGFYNVSYCRGSWEFLNELKWGIFIPVLCSPTVWLASLLKCLAGDRANGESSASQQQVSILKKKKNKPKKNQNNKKPNQTNQKNQKKTQNKQKGQETSLLLLLPVPATFPSSPMKRTSLTTSLYMYLARFYGLNSNIHVSSSEMGPYSQFLKERKLMFFSLQVHGFQAKFMKLWRAVTPPVLKTIKRSEDNKWACRSTNTASLGILLLNTRIILCIEAYLFEMENRLL